eukprot:TRINITY_DN5161_c0_g1_i1.p1 TRINITY_DN5161_c0_g1~~TRINITY_DN5161_c0_g1_i1.p1  ORF type:complete len:336 (+),score=51.61 TRINITY_DN5161_c0_g1_i1:106-1113(+)
MILLWLLSICCINKCLGEHASCEGSRTCVEFNQENWISSAHPKPRSILVIRPLGRLGNHLISFGVIQALRKSFDAYITRETFEFIAETFQVTEDVASIPILEDRFCSPSKMNFEAFEGSIEELLSNRALAHGRLLNLWRNGYKSSESVCCPTTELMEFMLEGPGSPPILSALECKEEFRVRSNDILKEIVRSRSSSKTPMFIGVHDRRTDYTSYLSDKYSLKELKKSYFSAGMEYFEEEFDDDYDVIFVWVSDDPSWGKKKFRKKSNVYFKGNSDETSPSSDFCLLTASNHTIMSRGSFSTFAAILAKGEYYTEYGAVVPTYLQYKKKKLKPHQY